MKKNYFIKTLTSVFIMLLLMQTGRVLAQNRNFLDFDGSNDYVKYNDDDTLGRMDSATDYTIEAWIYPVDGRVAEYDRVLQRYYTFNIQMYDGNNDGKVEDWYFVIIDGGNNYYNTEGDATLTSDAWNHIMVINNSTDGSLKLYVNGVDVTQSGGYSNRDLPAAQSNDNLYIGQKGNGSSYFGGYIDEVRLKNVAVNPADIHYNRTDNQYSSDGNTAGLFHFNEGTGTSTVNEASSSNASLYNGVSWRDWDYASSDHLPLAHEWTGGTDTVWATSGNWDGGVPSNSNDMIIRTGLTNYPVISTSTEADCNNLLIESGASLEISSSSSSTGSLIIHGTVSNSGTITANRYMTNYSSNNNGWHFLSSPVDNFTIAGTDFEPTAGDDDLYEYDETATSANWLNYNGGSFGDTEFEVGKGYLVAYKTAATKQFTGDLNTGSHTMNLSYTSGAASPGWNLLGNPYTSAIDWDLLTKTGSVDGSVYVLRASDGAYISWNGSTGDLTDGVIPSMQGYFVKATAANQSVTMEVADQIHATGTYYKSTQSQNTMIVKVTGEKGSSNAYIQFRDDATKTFDHAIDAYKLFGFSSAPQVYTNDGENIYSINCLPDNLKDYWLPLSVKTDYPGEYTLNFSGLSNMNDNLKVKLKDLKLNTTVNLSEGDNYNFVYSTGDDINRFELEFFSVTGVNNKVDSENSIVIYTSNNNLIIRNTDNKMLTGTVSILNLLGQVVYSDKLNGSSLQTVNTGLKPGIYIVKLIQNNVSSVSKKIMIH